MRTLPVPEPNAVATSHVYVMRAGPYFKIGFTANDPRMRLKEIQTSSPEPVYLLGAIPGTMADEAQLHQRYADRRAEGEWFRLTWEDVGAILGGVSLIPPLPRVPVTTRTIPRDERWYPTSPAEVNALLLREVRKAWPGGDEFAPELELAAAMQRPGTWCSEGFARKPGTLVGFLAMALRESYKIPRRITVTDEADVLGYLRDEVFGAEDVETPSRHALSTAS